MTEIQDYLFMLINSHVHIKLYKSFLFQSQTSNRKKQPQIEFQLHENIVLSEKFIAFIRDNNFEDVLQ